MEELSYTPPIRYTLTLEDEETQLQHQRNLLEPRHPRVSLEHQQNQLSERVLLDVLEELFPSQNNPDQTSMNYVYLGVLQAEVLLTILVTTWLVPLLWNLWKMLADL